MAAPTITHAYAAVTFSGVSSVFVPFASGVAAGDTVLVAIHQLQTTIRTLTSIVDDGGNPYSPMNVQLGVSGSTANSSYAYFSEQLANALAATEGVTIAWNANSTGRLAAIAISPAVYGNLTDEYTSGTSTGTSHRCAATPLDTLGDVFMFGVASMGGNVTTTTPSDSYTRHGGDHRAPIFTKESNSALSDQTCDFTISPTARAATGVLGAFYAAGGGGTVYELNLGGSITPAGAVTRAVATRLAGAVSPASALVHVIAQALASTLASAGALHKATGRSRAGAIAPEGATSAATSKTLAGELEPSGTVEQIKLIAQALEGSIEPAGVLTRDTSKALTGSLTPEGDLAQATDKRLAGSVATSGTLARQVARASAGEISPAGEVTATRVIVRAFSASLSLAGALVRSALKRTGGTVAPSGDLAPAPSKQLGGTLTPTGQVRRAITRGMAGSVSLTATLARALVQAAPLDLRRGVTRYVGPITRTASRIGHRLASILKPGTRRTKGH